MEWYSYTARNFNLQHGDEVMRELLVNYVITRGNRASEPMWKEFCVRLKLCTKATKFISLNMHHYEGNEMHHIRIKNGQGRFLVNLSVKDTELNQYLGE